MPQCKRCSYKIGEYSNANTRMRQHYILRHLVEWVPADKKKPGSNDTWSWVEETTFFNAIREYFGTHRVEFQGKVYYKPLRTTASSLPMFDDDGDDSQRAPASSAPFSGSVANTLSTSGASRMSTGPQFNQPFNNNGMDETLHDTGADNTLDPTAVLPHTLHTPPENMGLFNIQHDDVFNDSMLNDVLDLCEDNRVSLLASIGKVIDNVGNVAGGSCETTADGAASSVGNSATLASGTNVQMVNAVTSEGKTSRGTRAVNVSEESCQAGQRPTTSSQGAVGPNGLTLMSSEMTQARPGPSDAEGIECQLYLESTELEATGPDTLWCTHIASWICSLPTDISLDVKNLTTIYFKILGENQKLSYFQIHARIHLFFKYIQTVVRNLADQNQNIGTFGLSYTDDNSKRLFHIIPKLDVNYCKEVDMGRIILKGEIRWMEPINWVKAKKVSAIVKQDPEASLVTLDGRVVNEDDGLEAYQRQDYIRTAVLAYKFVGEEILTLGTRLIKRTISGDRVEAGLFADSRRCSVWASREISTRESDL